MSQRTEQEIMRNWKTMDLPFVSVCCITYNHEAYIRDAIESFLMQETDFPFEVIVHDDASMDRTAKILKDYAAKYPHIIKPIYQTFNQYSKGIKIYPNYVWPQVRGEFVAFCEGDDFWTDPLKLCIQVREMEKHPECDMSFHPALVKYMDKSRPDSVQGNHRQETCIIPLSEVIRGGGGFCPTVSLVVKKRVLENLPDWFCKDAPIADLFIQIYGARRGGALFINRNMSVYQTKTPGSWTMQSLKITHKSREKHNRFMKCIDLLMKDVPANNIQDVEFLQSGIECSFSVFLIRNKLFKEFKKSICISHDLFPFKNMKQIFLYYFRFCPIAFYLYDAAVSKFRRILAVITNHFNAKFG